MIQIKLPRGVWRFDPEHRLGEAGGFGAVFSGVDADGRAVAVKKLHVSAREAAHRELRIADELVGKAHKNVLTVYDAGQDADSDAYYVVMALAEGSLEEYIRKNGRVNEGEAATILLEIANGLSEVRHLVHRDMKPANVLREGGAWKIADFGIARFVEEATSSHTLSGCLSPPYAAPEQWTEERVTAATDIYALGCVAHALINGAPPFVERTREDFRRAHLEKTPPSLETDSRLRALVSTMLRKEPDTRPALTRVIAVLTDVLTNPAPAAATPGASALQKLNAAEIERQAREAAEAAAKREAKRRRVNLAQVGLGTLEAILQNLALTVQLNASETKVIVELQHLTAIIRGAKLEVNALREVVSEGPLPMSKWDVVTYATISVQQLDGEPWSHDATLWYMRLPGHDEYRWYEVSYRRNALLTEGPGGLFAITDVNDADLAAGGGMHVTEIASGPTPIDDENEPAFIDGWLHRFALAGQGKLRGF